MLTAMLSTMLTAMVAMSSMAMQMILRCISRYGTIPLLPMDVGISTVVESHGIVIGAICTVFVGPWQIAFGNQNEYDNDNDNDNGDNIIDIINATTPAPTNSTKNAADYVEVILETIFLVDILVNFNLAFYQNELLVFQRAQICTTYLKRMFWVDLLGVFPFESVALWLWLL